MRVLRISHSAVVGEWRNREREVRRAGVEVRSVSARRWDEGGRVIELRPEPGEDVVGVRTWGTHPALFLYDPRPLWRLLGEHWDVLDLHEEPYALATAEVLLLRRLRRSRVPYLLYSAQNIAKRYPVPFRWWERAALRGAAAVSVCNRAAGEILRAKGLRRPELVGLGVDTARFHPADAPDGTADGPPADDATAARHVQVGYVGRLAPHKGVDVLLRAVARHPHLTLDLAGGGPDEAALRALATRLGLDARVRFLGHVGADALPDLYRRLDVLAVPSVPTPGWLEQFCRVAVEAMASGVPVVASASGALPEVVGDAGLLVAPGDPVALADALVEAAGPAAPRLRAAGPVRAAEYTWSRVGARYLELYRDVARGAQGGRAPGGRSDVRHNPQSDPVPAGRLEVVVVAYGAPGLLADALAGVAGELPVTVVDNSSSPEVYDVVRAAGAVYLDPGANLGFASAVNLGVAHSTPGADVLLLNPDARVDAAGARALHRALLADPRLAAVAPRQVGHDGTADRVVWPFPTPLGTWLQAVGLGRLDRRPGFLIGAVLLLRRAALTEVGPFDEDFFLYGEETDWQRRATRAGWRVALVDAVRAVHAGAGTSTDPVRRDTHFHAGQERYLHKHAGPVGWAVARVAVVLGSAARGVLLPGERGGAARRRTGLYLRGPRRAEAALAGFSRAPGRAPARAGDTA